MEDRVGPKDNPGSDLVPTDLDHNRIGTMIDGFYGPEEWLNCSTYPIDELFELWKDNLRSMKWMPDFRFEIHLEEVDKGDLKEDVASIMKQTMINSGWPGDREGGGWNRSEAELEIRRQWESSLLLAE